MFESSTALVPYEPTILPATIEAELHRASDYARASRSKGTLAAYVRLALVRGISAPRAAWTHCRPPLRLWRPIWRSRRNGT